MQTLQLFKIISKKVRHQAATKSNAKNIEIVQNIDGDNSHDQEGPRHCTTWVN